MPLLSIVAVLFAGMAINVQNSEDQTVNSFKEARTRIVQSIEEGYNQDGPTSFELNYLSE